MKKTMLLASAAMIGGFLATHANAQGVPQTADIAKVDVQKVAAGYRASKVIGSSVLNEANETIGKIDDLLVTRDGKEPYAGRVHFVEHRRPTLFHLERVDGAAASSSGRRRDGFGLDRSRAHQLGRLRE